VTRRPRQIILATASAAALVTLVVSVLPLFELTYRSEAFHVAIETTAALTALVVAVLLAARYVRTRELADLLLTAALVLLGATNLFALVTGLGDAGPSRFETWAPPGGRLLAAAVFAAAALAPGRCVPHPRRALTLAIGACAAALATVAVLVALLDPVLPVGIDPALSPESSGRPRVVGPASLLALHAAIMFLFGLAAVGFTRRAERSGDELMAWFAAGVVLAAFARLNYFLFPSVQSEWVYTGDFLRLASHVLLLAGAGRQVVSDQRRLADLAVIDERRRIARELHDGLAQDLAYITGQTRLLGDGEASEVGTRISAAAERALDESRDAIAALTRPAEEALDVSLSRAAREVAGRTGAQLELQLAHDVHVPIATREALVRILREAMTNAARHGGARTIAVELDDAEKVKLRITDDGSGIGPPGDGDHVGFGLVSMRERAEALGGRFHIAPAAGRGTRVEVEVARE
jgi:signal transduction histidine kinase